MSEVSLQALSAWRMRTGRAGVGLGQSETGGAGELVVVGPTPYDHHRALGIGLL